MTAPIALPNGDPEELGLVPEQLEKLRLRLDTLLKLVVESKEFRPFDIQVLKSIANN